jgi:hypothetical protein
MGVVFQGYNKKIKIKCWLSNARSSKPTSKVPFALLANIAFGFQDLVFRIVK